MKEIEYLSKDILEDNFLKIFRPYHIAQKIVGCSRVDARDRFMTPPSVYQKLQTLIYVAVVFTLQYNLYKTSYATYFEKTPEVFYYNTLLSIIQMFTFICNLVHILFFNANAYSQLYIKLQ
jgi:hypothetical protein